MKCPRCGFDHPDSARTCVRCGCLLSAPDPAGLTVPRAGRRRRVSAAWYAFRRVLGFRWNKIRFDGLPEPKREREHPDVWTRGFLVALTGIPVPSLPQWILHRRIRGAVFAAVALAGGLLLILLLGTAGYRWGIYVLALAQTLSVCDVPDWDGMTRDRRLTVAVLLSFFLFTILSHFELDWLHRGLDAANLTVIPPYYRTWEIAAGNLVRIQPRGNYRPGDVVLVSGRGRFPGSAQQLDLTRHLLIDRLLAAGPGEITVSARRITLPDGRHSPYRPLNDAAAFADRKLKLNEREFFIVFSAAWISAGDRRDRNGHLALGVRSGDIQGKVMEIVFPVWKRRTL